MSQSERLVFLGLSLGGGKSDKASLVVLDYFPKFKKIFLSKIYDKIKNDENISADLKIYEIIEHHRKDVQFLAMDVPWDLPLCLRCQLKCPGFENCHEPHIEWMWDQFRKLNKKKKPKKIFTPYTQRCVEIYLASQLEEGFLLSHAMGANSAPLLARAAFLHRRFQLPSIEVFPKLSLWRMGRTLDIRKSQLRGHRQSVGGEETRRHFLKALSENEICFIYDQDFKIMIESNHAFEAFIAALTGFLKYAGATELRPKDFPVSEAWIEFPKTELEWSKILRLHK